MLHPWPTRCQTKPVPQDGAGVPDGFQRLWTPHRMAYIKGENRAVGTGPERLPVLPDPGLPTTPRG